MRIAGLLLATLASCAVGATVADGRAEPTGAAPPPAAARAAGYTLNTFHVGDVTAAQIDFGQTLAPGRKLYFWNLFGCQAEDAEAVLPGDGTFRVTSHCGPSGTLMSGVAKPGAPGYVGTAFGGGGYFEAEIAYDPAAVNLGEGWPAWWTMSAEHLWAMPGAAWPGQGAVGRVPYEHFVEPDPFEALAPPPHHTTSYLGSVHDWYGAFDKTCRHFCSSTTPYSFNLKSGPPGHDWNAWHKIAMLWVPATATAAGSLTFYLDGVKQGASLSWTRYDGRAASPPVEASTPWRFGVIDRQHLVLIFGAGRHAPLRVRSINVWQASAAANIAN
jgi:hypothetical protein